MFKLPMYAGIILKKDDQVLMVKRHNTNWACGQWNFPGGLVEKDETLVQAAVREAYEEVGVLVAAGDFELVHVLSVRANSVANRDARDAIVGVYFMAQKWEGIAFNREPHRHTQIGWFSLGALPSESTNHALRALDGLIAGVYYSEAVL